MEYNRGKENVSCAYDYGVYQVLLSVAFRRGGR